MCAPPRTLCTVSTGDGDSDSGHAYHWEVRKLKKSEVEAMLDAYDSGPVEALTTALTLTLETQGATWARLIEMAQFDVSRTADLMQMNTPALDELLKHLVENRSL